MLVEVDNYRHFAPICCYDFLDSHDAEGDEEEENEMDVVAGMFDPAAVVDCDGVVLGIELLLRYRW